MQWPEAKKHVSGAKSHLTALAKPVQGANTIANTMTTCTTSPPESEMSLSSQAINSIQPQHEMGQPIVVSSSSPSSSESQSVMHDAEEVFGVLTDMLTASIDHALTHVNVLDYNEIPEYVTIHAFFYSQRSPPIYQVPDDSRPYVKILANGYECLPLLDSGSMACIIVYANDDELKPFNGKIEPCNTKVSTVNKENVCCSGVIFMEYTFCGKKRTLPTLLLKSDRSQFIVGINFWRAFGIKFAWEEDGEAEPIGAVPANDDKGSNVALVESKTEMVNVVNLSHDSRPKGMLSLATLPSAKRIKAYVPRYSTNNRHSVGQMGRIHGAKNQSAPSVLTTYESAEVEALIGNKITNEEDHASAYTHGPTLALLEMLKNMPENVRVSEVAIQPEIRTAEGALDTINDITPEKHTCVSKPHHLTPEQQKELDEVIALIPFTPTEGPLNKTNVYVQRINTGDAPPSKSRQYPLSPYMIAEIEQEVQKLIDRDIVQPIDFSPWRSPILWVRKKAGGGRIVVDARGINKVTTVDAYPTLNVDTILRNLPKAMFISCLDMSMAYHQIEIHPEDRIKTSFVVGHKFYCFKRAIMGFCNSAADLAKILDKVFGDLVPHVYHYVDDFVIVSSTFEEHISLLRKIAERMKKANLTISKKKSSFCYSRVTFLGYVLTKEGLQANLDRVKPILEYPRPKTVKEMRRWVGLVGWYRRFIENAAELLAPLTNLMKGESKTRIEWDDEAETAFLNTKRALLSPAILASPDYALPFRIYTDASLVAGAAVLTQVQEGREKVIAFHSVKFTRTQQNYSATERECLAVISGVEKFRPYVDGVPFTVITDHSSLRWLHNLREPHGKLARWAVRLQAFDITFEHRPGRLMTVPDALSRAVPADMIEMKTPVTTNDQWYDSMCKYAQSGKSQHYKYENGLLYRRGKYSVTSGDRIWTICIPEEKIQEVLHEKHDCQSHVGFWKTLRSINESYYWPGMHQDVYKYVAKCTVCHQTKPSNEATKTATGKYFDPKAVGRVLSIDLVGPLPPSKHNKHTWLMVAVDAFSRYVFTKSCVRATAYGITEWLEKDIFYKFCVPEILISDNGSQFTSEWFSNVMKSYRITHYTTPVYHPQANQVEPTNKSLKQMLRAELIEKCSHVDWANYVHKVTMRLNTIPRMPVGVSPHEIIFGKPKIMTGDEHTLIRDVNPPLGEESERKEALHKEVAEQQREKHELNKRQHDLRARNRIFRQGECVYVKIYKQSDAAAKYTQKLAPVKRQAIIKEVLGNKDTPNTYLLVDLQGKPIGKFHASDIYRG